MKKILFPVVMLVASVTVAVCDFVSSLKDEDLDEKISKEVSRQLNSDVDPE